MSGVTLTLRRTTAPPRLAAKSCGFTRCPNEAKNLWAKAHIAVMRWEEHLQHPHDPELKAKVTECLRELGAAAKTAEPVMEVRLEAVR